MATAPWRLKRTRLEKELVREGAEESSAPSVLGHPSPTAERGHAEEGAVGAKSD